MTERPLVYIIAGEASGDILGGRLMASLKEKNPDMVFAGVGGIKMEAEGLKSLFPMHELSVMGLTEIVPHIPRLMRRIRETVADILKRRPVVLVTIDSPGFSFRVAKKLKGKGIQLIHYVAPSVWAWKPGRARKVAAFLDHLLTLLPFEPPYFEKEGLAATFTGHPVVESDAGKGDGDAFRIRHGIDKGTPLITVLPGSRGGEVKALLPVFRETLNLLSRSLKDMRVVIPTIPHLKEKIISETADWPVKVLCIEGDDEKFSAFAASDVALAASGTVSLELAMAETPAVIAYKVSPVTAWLARRLLKTPYASLINVVLEREAVPEYLQENCRAENLCEGLLKLLSDDQIRTRQIEDMNEALKRMGRDGPSPSGRAADTILEILEATSM